MVQEQLEAWFTCRGPRQAERSAAEHSSSLPHFIQQAFAVRRSHLCNCVVIRGSARPGREVSLPRSASVLIAAG